LNAIREGLSGMWGVAATTQLCWENVQNWWSGARCSDQTAAQSVGWSVGSFSRYQPWTSRQRATNEPTSRSEPTEDREERYATSSAAIAVFKRQRGVGGWMAPGWFRGLQRGAGPGRASMRVGGRLAACPVGLLFSLALVDTAHVDTPLTRRTTTIKRLVGLRDVTHQLDK
jgi:hypothetical protein